MTPAFRGGAPGAEPPGPAPGRRRCLSARWAAGIALVGLALSPTPAPAQLEILLRDLPASRPRLGACGQYRFRAEEPGGQRTLMFHARVERVSSQPDGSVGLRFWSGDSLEARAEVAPALFRGRGGDLQDAVLSLVEIAHGDTTRLQRGEWGEIPGLAPASV